MRTPVLASHFPCPSASPAGADGSRADSSSHCPLQLPCKSSTPRPYLLPSPPSTACQVLFLWCLSGQLQRLFTDGIFRAGRLHEKKQNKANLISPVPCCVMRRTQHDALLCQLQNSLGLLARFNDRIQQSHRIHIFFRVLYINDCMAVLWAHPWLHIRPLGRFAQQLSCLPRSQRHLALYSLAMSTTRMLIHPHIIVQASGFVLQRSQSFLQESCLSL